MKEAEKKDAKEGMLFKCILGVEGSLALELTGENRDVDADFDESEIYRCDTKPGMLSSAVRFSFTSYTYSNSLIFLPKNGSLFI